jgi:hypothetical protein
MKKIGVSHVHLAVGPVMADGGQEYLETVKQQDWTISCTMLAFNHKDYSTLDTIKVTGGVVPDDNGETIVDANISKASKDGALDGNAHPGLKRKGGHIGFLGHGDYVEFRNIRIKE